MSDLSAARAKVWRGRLQGLGTRARGALPFVFGVFAALVAILLYHVLFPGPPPLTTRDVNTSIAQALASATPAPAFSARVYQIIQPSLVLVETHLPGTNGSVEPALGSGVVVDDQGDILTRLHVVAQARDVQVTFADGTQSSAEVTVKQPENDIAVLRATRPRRRLWPRPSATPTPCMSATRPMPSAIPSGSTAR